MQVGGVAPGTPDWLWQQVGMKMALLGDVARATQAQAPTTGGNTGQQKGTLRRSCAATACPQISTAACASLGSSGTSTAGPRGSSDGTQHGGPGQGLVNAQEMCPKVPVQPVESSLGDAGKGALQGPQAGTQTEGRAGTRGRLVWGAGWGGG